MVVRFCIAYIPTPGPPSPPELTLQPLSPTLLTLTMEQPFSWQKYPILTYTIAILHMAPYTITNDSLVDGRYTRNITRERSDECEMVKVTATATNPIGESEPFTVQGGFPLGKLL